MKLAALKQGKLFIVLRNLIIVEALAYLAFTGLALSADWGEIFKHSILFGYVRFEVVEFLLLGLFQVGLIFLVFIRSLVEDHDINEMIRTGEHERMEFKTSLRWDARRNQVNKELERMIMKTVAAFLNSDGGYLIIGVNDNGELVGLENDITSLPRQDIDGFENHFNNLFNAMVGPEFRRSVKLKFYNIKDKTICLVDVEAGHKPAYLKSSDNEDFYIRTGNATTSLKVSEVATYISSRWR